MKSKWTWLLLLGCGSLHANTALQMDFSSLLQKSHVVIEAGAYGSLQGQKQHINIQSLIGDDFTLGEGHGYNVLFGVGYFIDGQTINDIQFSYGINGFYFPTTSVSGDVIQENIFDNLSYRYEITHLPIYAEMRLHIPSKFNNVAFTTNLGIGPNFMQASNFSESSLDGITIPDQIFSSHTTTTVSGTAGVGVEWGHVLGKYPVECGYRFFYLGSGRLNKTSDEVLNNLRTGNIYANALLCSARF